MIWPPNLPGWAPHDGEHSQHNATLRVCLGCQHIKDDHCECWCIWEEWIICLFQKFILQCSALSDAIGSSCPHEVVCNLCQRDSGVTRIHQHGGAGHWRAGWYVDLLPVMSVCSPREVISAYFSSLFFFYIFWTWCFTIYRYDIGSSLHCGYLFKGPWHVSVSKRMRLSIPSSLSWR